jgi:hypothetical protein
MIEVRIRHEYDANAVHLCTWPATELDDVIPTIKSWGLSGIGRDLDYDPELTGTLVYSPQGGYFEVIIHDGGDADA